MSKFNFGDSVIFQDDKGDQRFGVVVNTYEHNSACRGYIKVRPDFYLNHTCTVLEANTSPAYRVGTHVEYLSLRGDRQVGVIVARSRAIDIKDHLYYVVEGKHHVEVVMAYDPTLVSVDERAEALLGLLSETPTPVEVLVQEANLSETQVLIGLTHLELDGRATRLPQNQWVKN